MLNSYPSPQQLGSRNVREIFNGPVVIQEKVDGSQISFRVDPGPDYVSDETSRILSVRSRGEPIDLTAPNKMFSVAVGAILSRQDRLIIGATYRGEYLSRPRHNVLAYERVPTGNIVLFDVELPDGSYMDPLSLAMEASAQGMETVPVLFQGETTPAAVKPLLEAKSFLGGVDIEGVVVKNYAMVGGEAFAAKYVSDKFKEKMGAPITKDRIVPFEEALAAEYRTEARWAKARQHLREAGKLTDSPRDIGLLVKEVQSDLFTECGEEIRERVVAHFTKLLQVGAVDGLALWYKDQLLKEAT